MTSQAERTQAAPRPKLVLDFHTCDYEFSHGHSPRGKGSWAFGPTRSCDLDDIVWAPSGLSFSEAKRWLRKQVQSPGSKARDVFEKAPTWPSTGGRVSLDVYVAT